jgi:membrane-bound lytic murein transglycosylase B
MGQTQFMPSTFMKHAVDADGDGHKNIWTDVPDALASAANYLKSLQWNGQQNWGREVRLPQGFDVGLASLDTSASETVKSLSEWSELGVTQADGQPLPQRAEFRAALLLPAGAHGPAFLVYDNFRAILKWNRSTFYAIAVGHLADRLINMPALQGPHVTEEPLRREEVLVLQAGLHKLGFLKVEPDGVAGGLTRLAVRAFQRANGLAPDGYATRTLITTVADKSGLALPFPPRLPNS